MIKASFSEQARKLFRRPEWINRSKARQRESTIGQRRFWEHEIRDQDDFNRHFDYIHWNPVKHRHVARAVDWPYSTFHQYVAQGLYLANWGGDGIDRWIPDAFADIP